MLASELIAYLQEVIKAEGDIRVCISQTHEYWGSTEDLLNRSSCQVSPWAQPDGPKSGKSEKAIILGR